MHSNIVAGICAVLCPVWDASSSFVISVSPARSLGRSARAALSRRDSACSPAIVFLTIVFLGLDFPIVDNPIVDNRVSVEISPIVGFRVSVTGGIGWPKSS